MRPPVKLAKAWRCNASPSPLRRYPDASRGRRPSPSRTARACTLLPAATALPERTRKQSSCSNTRAFIHSSKGRYWWPQWSWNASSRTSWRTCSSPGASVATSNPSAIPRVRLDLEIDPMRKKLRMGSKPRLRRRHAAASSSLRIPIRTSGDPSARERVSIQSTIAVPTHGRYRSGWTTRRRPSARHGAG